MLASPLTAQAVHTSDVGFSTIRYGFGAPVHGALTLNEAITAERERSSTSADGILSVFDGGSWSFQGSLLGTRFSPAIPTSGFLEPLFRSVRGEFSAGSAATAQQGSMPTMQAVATARAHLLDLDRGAWSGGSIARSFDGETWRTTLIGEAGAWMRRGTTVVTGTWKPIQTTGGDLLSDTEASVAWTGGAVSWETTAGVRLGQAQRVNVGWIAVSATFPVRQRYLMTASVGSYPDDLLQGLPAGYYAGVSFRLPSRAASSVAPGPVIPAPRGVSGDPGVPSVWQSAVVAYFETPDSGSTLRLMRVRAPGAQRVEVIGDFTDWEPARLVRGRVGEWELTMRIDGGTHRFNIRVDGTRWVVPVNVGRAADDFKGVVGLMVVP